MNEEWFPTYELFVGEITKELPDDFYELRRIGENENLNCKLIREDSVQKFVVYTNKENISLNSIIKPSIYETNSFLLEYQINPFVQFNNGIKLIEYAAFFGSIQIIRYLKSEGVELTSSLWLYSIHGNDAEIIPFLEENKVEQVIKIKSYQNSVNLSYKDYFNESVKCHHNDISNFFLNNYLQNGDEKPFDTFIRSLKYYNFELIQNEFMNESSFCYFCEYDYYLLAKNILANREIDINQKAIQKVKYFE